jgi:hypothetical protein
MKSESAAVAPTADDLRRRATLALVELCHGGEFAAWMSSSSVELPFAALREYEEAVRIVREILESRGLNITI